MLHEGRAEETLRMAMQVLHQHAKAHVRRHEPEQVGTGGARLGQGSEK